MFIQGRPGKPAGRGGDGGSGGLGGLAGKAFYIGFNRDPELMIQNRRGLYCRNM